MPVFSSAWFEAHQPQLLRLLALPGVGRLMRRCLAIRPHDVGWAKPIIALTPDSYTVENGDGTVTTDFRSHPKFAKRLYHQLKPLWFLAHGWDMAVANPLVPALNVGFDTLLEYPDASGTGPSGHASWEFGGTPSWAWVYAARNTGVTTEVDSNPTTAAVYNNTSFAFASIESVATVNEWRTRRSHFSFNTAALGPAAISNAQLSLWHTSDSGIDSLSVTSSYDLFSVTLDHPTTPHIVTFGTTPLSTAAVPGATVRAMVTGPGPGYYAWTLSTRGISSLERSGISRFAVRESTYDATGTTPSAPSTFLYNRLFGVFPDTAGNTNDPKLEVTYTKPTLPRNRPSLRPRIFAPGRAR